MNDDDPQPVDSEPPPEPPPAPVAPPPPSGPAYAPLDLDELSEADRRRRE